MNMKQVYISFLITSLLLLVSCWNTAEESNNTSNDSQVEDSTVNKNSDEDSNAQSRSGTLSWSWEEWQQDVSENEIDSVGQNTVIDSRNQDTSSWSWEVSVDIEEYKDEITDQEIKLEESFKDIFGSFDDE